MEEAPLPTLGTLRVCGVWDDDSDAGVLHSWHATITANEAQLGAVLHSTNWAEGKKLVRAFVAGVFGGTSVGIHRDALEKICAFSLSRTGSWADVAVTTSAVRAQPLMTLTSPVPGVLEVTWALVPAAALCARVLRVRGLRRAAFLALVQYWYALEQGLLRDLDGFRPCATKVVTVEFVEAAKMSWIASVQCGVLPTKNLATFHTARLLAVVQSVEALKNSGVPLSRALVYVSASQPWRLSPALLHDTGFAEWCARVGMQVNMAKGEALPPCSMAGCLVLMSTSKSDAGFTTLCEAVQTLRTTRVPPSFAGPLVLGDVAIMAAVPIEMQ